MKLTFRQANNSDAEALRAILESQNLPTESVGKAITDFYIAVDEQQIVGVAGFEYYGEDVLLRSVAIKSSFQHNGLGSQLVDWMVQLARTKGISRIVLLTETAERFFAKKGFAVIERAEITNIPMKRSSQFGGGCCSSAACMQMDLSK